MAESFGLPNGEWVHFTNSAVEALFKAWERVARERSHEPGMMEVAEYLRGRLEQCGTGDRAFGMIREWMPDELMSAASQQALSIVIEGTIRDLSLIPDVVWDPELAESWRERLRRLKASVRELLRAE